MACPARIALPLVLLAAASASAVDPCPEEGGREEAECLRRQARVHAAAGRGERAAELELRGFALSPEVEWIFTDRRIDVDAGPHLLGTVELLREVGWAQDADRLEARARELGALGPESDLVAERWFAPLPDVPIRLRDGGTFRVEEHAGKVIVLDFWASWCPPCIEKLPALHALYRARRDRGMELVAVNVGESPDAIRAFLISRDLEMPVGLYDARLADAYNAGALPTTIVADTRGRQRLRLDGAADDSTERIGKLVDELLDPERPESRTPLAGVTRGAERLEVVWSRESAGPVEGLAVVPGEARATLVAIAGRKWVRYDSGGRVEEYGPRPNGAGLLRVADLDEDGVGEVYSFRRGSRVIVTIPPPEDDAVAFEAPAPLLDMLFVPGAAHPVWLATLEGVLGGPGFDALEAVPGAGPALDLALTANGVEALTRAGRCRVAAPTAPLEACVAAPEAAGLITTRVPDVRGIRSRGVTAAAGGRLFEGAGETVVLTRSGRLVVLDATGVVRWSARWPEASGFAVGDLDGDGRDELAVASGSRVSLLRSAE